METHRDKMTDFDAAVEPCWKLIGVMGDGSCPELSSAVHCRNCKVFMEAGQQLFERQPPAEYVEEQTTQLAEEVLDGAVDSDAMIIFRIGEEWLALDVATVVEVAEPRAVHRVPHRTDRLLLGIVNIRGELQLCVSLRELLGIGGADQLPGFNSLSTEQPGGDAEVDKDVSEKSAFRLLIAESKGGRWAFAVDEVAGVHRVGTDQLGNVPSTVSKSAGRFAKAVFNWDGKSVGRLADDRLFASLKGSIG
jgi:chemotaxis-related protein WspD